MTESRFVLQFDVSEISSLAARYVVDDQGADDQALRAGREISSGNYSRDNLQVIFRWKTGGRGISRLRRNTDEEIACTGCCGQVCSCCPLRIERSGSACCFGNSDSDESREVHNY